MAQNGSSKQDVARRLGEAVRAAGGSAEVAARGRVPLRTLANYLSAKSDMKIPTLVALARACGVSIEWLATGEDAAGSQQAVATAPKAVLDHETLKVVIEEIEEHLRTQRKNLPPGKKAELIDLAYSLALDTPDRQQKGATILRLVKLAG